jgi:hypothetical protein
MHVECIDNTESIDYVIIYIQATLQWVKVSFAIQLSTFYCYFASDNRKCINYCLHCRKLKCIHYYSSNFRHDMFDHKSDSICKTIPIYCPCRYKWWYTSSIFLDSKYSHTVSWRESVKKLVGYSIYMQLSVDWATLNKVFKSTTFAYIFIPKQIYYLRVRSPHHVRSYFWWGVERIEIKQLHIGG